MDVHVKSLAAFEIKDAEKGDVEAIVATLDVVDRDGEVIVAGAIEDGAKVKVSNWGHDAIYGERPIGKGAIAIEGNKAIFRGRIFLQTTEGRETFAVLKEMGQDQEWSFGFFVKGTEVPDDDWRERGAHRMLTKLETFEVSPVLIGAGRGTRTLALKAAESARVAQEQADAEAAAAAAQVAAQAAAEADAQAKAVALEREADAEYRRFQHTMRRFTATT